MEWTNSIYADNRYLEPYEIVSGLEVSSGAGSINDLNSERVARGGSYFFGSTDAVRSAGRIETAPTLQAPYYGFRCVRVFE